MINVNYVAFPSAITPIKATAGSAGYDVYSILKKSYSSFWT